MNHFLIQSNSNVEDLFIINIISIIPIITNEEEYLNVDDPILIVDNLGRFFNSKSPE